MLTGNKNVMLIREIEKKDDDALYEVIRSVMTAYGADPKTTVLGEESIKHMSSCYTAPDAVYYVVEENGVLAGGCGIRHLDGHPGSVCELQRMFLHPWARGKGYGSALMRLCLEKAAEFGYKQVYLESFSNMTDAIRLYEKTGFVRIPEPMGATGHSGCNVFMVKNIG
jgi:putative acetyltransferase